MEPEEFSTVVFSSLLQLRCINLSMRKKQFQRKYFPGKIVPVMLIFKEISSVEANNSLLINIFRFLSKKERVLLSF